ncbi:hypothetical protein J3F83DRAFT_731846 [Trichoderma novae-zelandiae]
MQIRSPLRLTSTIDIVDRATSISHIENHTRGALVSIDLNCPADLFYGRKRLVAKFSLSFTTKILDGFHKSVAVQDAKVGCFEADNNIENMVNNPRRPLPRITGDTETSFKNGTVEIEMQQPEDSRNIRIVLLLDAYPSNMQVSASLSTDDGMSRPSHAFTSTTRPDMVPSPNEERLQKLLCWTAALGHETLFTAYLDQGPSILNIEDEFGMTPFSWAALTGQASVIQLALQQDGVSSARQGTAGGPSPLEAAARSKDPTIFEVFLKLLKYFESLDGENDGPREAPRADNLLPLDDSEIEKELSAAVLGEQKETIGKLIDMRLNGKAGGCKRKWLASQMERAAREGTLCFVQVLKMRGAKVDPAEADDGGEENRSTPLMSAIEHDRTQVAEFLISHGAGDTEALRTAVERKQHSTIRKLLQVGIPVDENLKRELLATATRKRDSTTLMLLKLERGTGKLATQKDLHGTVDELFEATVVDFFDDKDPRFQEVSVARLMAKEDNFFSVNDETDVKFRWFHLPANNMKWAEAVIAKIYHHEPSSAYKVLDPKRWVKRQHEGERGSAHARFMIPACHDFSEAFKHKKGEILGNGGKDKHMFLFMPYLHWDEDKTMRLRSQFIAENSPGALKAKATKLNSAKEELLLKHYLLPEDHCDPNSRHVLHIRRTLDQYLYHNLKDTKVRDADQTVHRYQEGLNRGKESDQKDPLTAIMVDQLWLWVLVDSSGRARTIVTCFQSRDWNDVGINATEQKRVMDPRRTTDVLQITKAYIQQRPSAVQTPYDLAGVIASRCSRALLDHSSDMLNFAEVYENSISYIMNEEAVLFNTFNTLMQTRTELDGPDDEDGLKTKPPLKKALSFKGLSNTIMGDLESLQKLLREDETPKRPGGDNPPPGTAGQNSDDRRELEQKQDIFKSAEQRCKSYREYTLDREIPDDSDIKQLRKLTGKDKTKHLISLLKKFGRFYALDITREITLLRQIKDIQDELEMMEKVFAEQKEALESMDRIIRTINQHNIDPSDDAQAKASNHRPVYRRASHGRIMERDYTGNHRSLLADLIDDDSDSDGDGILGDEYPSGARSGGFPGTGPRSLNGSSTKPTRSMIWGDLRERQNLPLRTVNRHSKQLKRMNERAKNTNLALSTLVDLKQKQNNMIDARAARQQAEQSHRMTLEAEKQGKTLMVFTIVTIIFLPLSFIAAFFAIPTKEFDNNVLTLGYVSKITCELH